VILKLKRTPGIYLVGFMAAGKTTIGRCLAEELGWTFVDIDDDIEAAEGSPISEIFGARGEGEFRRMEAEAIRKRVRDIERGRPMVLALGGGAFVERANYELLSENGVSVWLDCPLERIQTRVGESDNRPLARDPEMFRRLYFDRRPAYERSEYRIEISSDDPMDAVARILKLPIF
jgi:shikimate kinase